ncbi:MAG: hypothetical protein KC621_33935 [Myxococcales bacterium]|nr:hypothetical protein [Myxococcales bacterium]
MQETEQDRPRPSVESPPQAVCKAPTTSPGNQAFNEQLATRKVETPGATPPQLPGWAPTPALSSSTMAPVASVTDITRVDPTDAGSLAAARPGQRAFTPQGIRSNNLVQKQDADIGVSVPVGRLPLAVGGSYTTGAQQQTSRFTDHGCKPDKASFNHAFDFKGTIGYGSANALGWGQGATWGGDTNSGWNAKLGLSPSGPKTMPGGVGPWGAKPAIPNPNANLPSKVPGLSLDVASWGEATGSGRQLGVYRPNDGPDTNKLRVTTNEYATWGQKAGVLGTLSTDRKAGTAYTYDLDPKSPTAVARLKEYHDTGLQPGARDLAAKGTPDDRKRMTDFDQANARIKELEAQGRPSWWSFSARSQYDAQLQAARAQLGQARDGLNARWQKSVPLSAGGTGDIVPGLRMIREDQYVHNAQSGTGLMAPKKGDAKAATYGTTWQRRDGKTSKDYFTDTQYH